MTMANNPARYVTISVPCAPAPSTRRVQIVERLLPFGFVLRVLGEDQ